MKIKHEVYMKNLNKEGFGHRVNSLDTKHLSRGLYIIQRSNENNFAMLRDFIRCGCCDCAMNPTMIKNKNGIKQRYYLCSNHAKNNGCVSDNKLMLAEHVENFVEQSVRKLLANPAIAALIIHKLYAAGISLENAQDSLRNIDKTWGQLDLKEQRKIINMFVQNVVVDNNDIKILLNQEGVIELIRKVA